MTLYRVSLFISEVGIIKMKLLYKKGMGIGNVSARLLMAGSPVVNYHTAEAANAIMVLSRLNEETQVSPFIKIPRLFT